jgi:3,4-dihydroxy-2-butanone 4-phosphate synthase
MSQLSSPFTDVRRSVTASDRVARALAALRRGRPVLVQDDADRENEADLIASAELIDLPVMAQLIRDCSGIVCLCLDAEHVARLGLRRMVEHNESRHGTPFTVSIEAREGISTGVSAADRVTTVLAAIAPEAGPHSIVSPGPAAWPAGHRSRQAVLQREDVVQVEFRRLQFARPASAPRACASRRHVGQAAPQLGVVLGRRGGAASAASTSAFSVASRASRASTCCSSTRSGRVASERLARACLSALRSSRDAAGAASARRARAGTGRAPQAAGSAAGRGARPAPAAPSPPRATPPAASAGSRPGRRRRAARCRR